VTGPAYWGIAGHPISHSLTPRLFELVGNHLGMEGAEQVYIDAGGIDEFLEKVGSLEGEVWLSCTAPLKHSPQERLGVSGPDGVNAINQLRRVDGEWSGTSTDGLGFVASCKHIGTEPEGSTLRMRGGGSAARSIAAAWSDAGGRISTVKGRRALVDGPWGHSIVDGADADIAIDLDAMPAGGSSMDMEANLQVSISYGDGAGTDEFAVIMVVAQHLEAWKLLFAPEESERLPSLSLLLELLGTRAQ
tara:strand:+ start:924 stop:1664 length:741 start_codon:yes stop_codon:yes gene_type:complete